MKNKFKALIATLLLLSAILSSCASRHAGLSVTDAYSAASDSLSSANEYEIITERKVTSTDGLEVISSDKATYRRKADRFYMQNSDVSNPLLNMEGWYIDGYSYASYRTMKVKTKASIEEYAGSTSSSVSPYLPSIETDFLKGLRFEGEGDEKYFTVTFSDAQYVDIFGSAGIGGTIDGEVRFTVYFDSDANVTRTTTEFYMILSETRLYSVTNTSIKLSSPNIDPPADADSYQLVD